MCVKWRVVHLAGWGLIRHCWGMGKTDFPPSFSCPFLFAPSPQSSLGNLNNDDGDVYNTNRFQCCCWHEPILQLFHLIQTPWILGYLWFYSHKLPRDSPLTKDLRDEPSTETKCRLSSTIRYHWQLTLESVRFSCASATSLSFPERKKSMFWLFPRFPVSSSQTLINMHNSIQFNSLFTLYKIFT